MESEADGEKEKEGRSLAPFRTSAAIGILLPPSVDQPPPDRSRR